MRALQLVAAGAPLVAVDLPDPVPGSGDVVVRVGAAGICRSDTHYRSGDPRLPPLPRVLGHEVAGWVETAGDGTTLAVGTPVALHYQVGCGRCGRCTAGEDRFCPEGAMIGNQRDGGYAELVVVPERNAVPIPPGVTVAHAAVMMCSSVTALHALRKARLRPGERVAVYGAGGLGQSAIQLARALGASEVFTVDIDEGRLERAAALGATPVDATTCRPEQHLTELGGVDVAVELIGLASTIVQAIRSLRPLGRAAVAGLTGEAVPLAVYDDLMSREAEVIGVMDHTLDEAREVLDLAVAGSLSLDEVVTRSIPLDAAEVNRALDELESFGPGVRTVIVPDGTTHDPGDGAAP